MNFYPNSAGIFPNYFSILSQPPNVMPSLFVHDNFSLLDTTGPYNNNNNHHHEITKTTNFKSTTSSSTTSNNMYQQLPSISPNNSVNPNDFSNLLTQNFLQNGHNPTHNHTGQMITSPSFYEHPPFSCNNFFGNYINNINNTTNNNNKLTNINGCNNNNNGGNSYNNSNLSTPSSSNSLTLNQIVTVRMLMSGKEVGSIIGKKGDNVKKFREQSGARINISDGSCPERIVTVTGSVDRVFSAFKMICQKFEDDYKGSDSLNKSSTTDTNSSTTQSNEVVICPPVTLRLLVPATQCGSIIGKGGCKIKDIRDQCGASIQVASELLPQSSERSVTVSGAASAVASCIKQICYILLETPVKYGTVLYIPKPSMFSGANQNPPISPSPNQQSSNPFLPPSQQNPRSIGPLPSNNYTPNPMLTANQNQISNSYDQSAILLPFPNTHTPDHEILKTQNQFSPANFMSAFYSLNPVNQSPITTNPIVQNNNSFVPTIIPAMPPSSNTKSSPTNCSTPIPNQPMPPTTATNHIRELIISNEMIGCIIGRAGATINEIRALSGAQIKIQDPPPTTVAQQLQQSTAPLICDNTTIEGDSNQDRQVVLSGTMEAVNTAQLLINANLQSYRKTTNLPTNASSSEPPPSSSSSSSLLSSDQVHATTDATSFITTSSNTTSGLNSTNSIKITQTISDHRKIRRSFYSPY